MIEIKDLTVKYGKKTVLDRICLTLSNERFTAILGKNGSGKSTLLSCISRQIKYSGEIFLDGKNIDTIGQKEYARSVSFLPQSLTKPAVTVKELTEFGRNPYTGLDGRLSTEDNSIVEEALKITGMSEFSQRLLPTLSGGERQKAYLSMIIAQQANHILLDEPTTYMDICAQEEFIELIALLKQQKKSPTVVMHDLALAVRYTDDIAIMDSGKIVFFGSKEDCLKKEVIESVFSVKRINADNNIFFTATKKVSLK